MKIGLIILVVGILMTILLSALNTLSMKIALIVTNGLTAALFVGIPLLVLFFVWKFKKKKAP